MISNLSWDSAVVSLGQDIDQRLAAVVSVYFVQNRTEYILKKAFSNCTHDTGKKATFQQVTTMLATSKNVILPGHNHLPSDDDPTLWLSP